MPTPPAPDKSQDALLLRRPTAKVRRLLFWGLSIGWTLLLIWGLGWNLSQVREDVLELARAQARTFADQILIYRHWSAGHGGVYVEVSSKTPPNPYLEEVFERDVLTPSGRLLTLVNPAYMMREIFALEQEMLGLSGRITALRPVNPDNAPDSWERQALADLSAGATESYMVESRAGGEVLRLMRPLLMDAECLSCHAQHGYALGELRGGLSTLVDLQSLWAVGRAHRFGMAGGAGLLWLVGLGGLTVGCRHWARQEYQRLQAEESLRYLVQYDNLTGLANQSQFLAKLDLFLDRDRPQQATVAVVLVDLASFRKINNALGRVQGDHLLQTVAQRLRVAVGEQGWPFYFGNGVFALLLPFLKQPPEAGALARYTLEELARPCLLDQCELHLAAHCGIAVAPDDGNTAVELLQHAEIALQEAKGSGDALCYFSRALGVAAWEGVQLETELRRALENGELYLHYQPQYDMDGQSLIGSEALARWRHPIRGELAPESFIPLAESTGLIVPLGAKVLHMVCRQIAQWRAAGLVVPPVAVNLAAEQFRRPELVAEVQALLLETGISGSSLVLEVTESVLMHDIAQAMHTMQALKELGVRLALDDFGTGYSSLSYLKNLPLDCLKIDRSFVNDLPGDSDSAAIVAAIVGLGRSLGLATLAEGVNSSEQYAFLRELGCRGFQGFYFSRPLVAEDFAAGFHRRDQPAS
ncbi:putative bifunctional diguanylate cyclase/phosphodiesterase [Geoalkalibacter halelectricus]|uniref:EAL domain-containing protein n=1 Tax=Geoalkalibacter halelectricus TaxID=2847045 RepID=A0ABY5ZQ58_9BACT|nr:EAL domain-containing protein [Geoalkalibacter halelectricus]MDO3377006.1 EAL domain-containing protein [Geoalkalibacter halelectricus]UWZ81228.1 EAL domain-containing protein [Geoalkalibacter halelectricus]